MWALLFFLFFSRGYAEEPVSQDELPTKELAGYLASFVKESHGAMKLKDLVDSKYVYSRLAWEEGKGGTIADCVSWLHTAPFTIHIDKRYWAKSGTVERWTILFHELGHCACGLEHKGESGEEWLMGVLERNGFKTAHSHRLPDGCPDTLMHWTVPNVACVVVHRDEYLNSLFAKCQRPIRLAQDFAAY